MMLTTFTRALLGSLRDLAPLIVVILFFQLVVIQQPLPSDIHLSEILLGLVLVVVGLTILIQGLQLGLFPIGENLARAFAQKGSAFWLMLFAFALGFGTTIAEPALIAVAGKASETLAIEGFIADSITEQNQFALILRLTCAIAVGCAVMLGVLRILKGWPLHYIIIGGYALVLVLSLPAPNELKGIAYDAGVVPTSTITVPLVTALGVGLSVAIKGRSPLLDGFGLIALATVMPTIFVLALAALMF